MAIAYSRDRTSSARMAQRPGILLPEDNAKDIIPLEKGDELLAVCVAVEIYFIIIAIVILKNFRGDFHFPAAAQMNFISPHLPILVEASSLVHSSR